MLQTFLFQPFTRSFVQTCMHFRKMRDLLQVKATQCNVLPALWFLIKSSERSWNHLVISLFHVTCTVVRLFSGLAGYRLDENILKTSCAVSHLPLDALWPFHPDCRRSWDSIYQSRVEDSLSWPDQREQAPCSTQSHSALIQCSLGLEAVPPYFKSGIL